VIQWAKTSIEVLHKQAFITITIQAICMKIMQFSAKYYKKTLIDGVSEKRLKLK